MSGAAQDAGGGSGPAAGRVEAEASGKVNAVCAAVREAALALQQGGPPDAYLEVVVTSYARYERNS